ncbi:MAG TPA: winged helix-turn-helix domain-containing protein [Candidatus Tumulicola sp.]|jgi:DNA-binding winged helix-turn-helix (wHTH) protein/Flp pilus assembly protein TadD
MSVYGFGPFYLDAERLLLVEGGKPMQLGPKVVETLLALVERGGEIVSKQALLDRVWPEGYVDEANLAQNVYVLRKALRAHWGQEVIETIPRRGYRFVATATLFDRVPVQAQVQTPISDRAVVQASPAPARIAAQMRWRWPAVAALAAFLVTASAAFGLLAPKHGAQWPVTSEASRLYAIGRFYWNQRTPDSTAKSLSYFNRLIRENPSDARGYAAMALADEVMGDYMYGPLPASTYFRKAREYARKALDLDPRLGDAYAVLGIVDIDAGRMTPRDLDVAIRQLRRAIAIDPQSAAGHEWLGVALVESGQFARAYAELRQADQLDPLSVATTSWLASTAYLEGRYDDALGYARETLDLSPMRADALQTIGLTYEARGDHRRAIAAFRRMAAVCASCRPEAAALLAVSYSTVDASAARAEFAVARAKASSVGAGDLAAAYAAVGQRRGALTWLRRDGVDAFVRAEVAADPRFASLRGDVSSADKRA